MMLDDTQIARLVEHLAAAGLRGDVRTELLDHLCCEAEALAEDGQLDIVVATDRVLERWPTGRVQQLQQSITFTTKTKPMLVRIATSAALVAGLAFLWPAAPTSNPVTPGSSTPSTCPAVPEVVAAAVTWPDFDPPTASPLAGVSLHDAHSGFGMRIHPISKRKQLHRGIDFRAKLGTEVLATAAGRVVFAGENGKNGIQVRIVHEDGYVTVYNHLQVVTVERAERVTQGQVIAKVGNTGQSTGPHLHYEVLLNDQPIDPLALLD